MDRKKALSISILLLLPLVFPYVVPEAHAVSEPLLESTTRITRTINTVPELFNGVPSSPNITVTYGFSPLGAFWFSNSQGNFTAGIMTLKCGALGVAFPLSTGGKVYYNSTHVAYNLSPSLGCTGNIWLYFKNQVGALGYPSPNMKVIIAGDLSTSGTLNLLFLGGSLTRTTDLTGKTDYQITMGSTRLGFDWSDSASLNPVYTPGKLAYSVGTSFVIDPTTIATSTSATPFDYSFQRKTCQIGSRYIAAFSDGTDLIESSATNTAFTTGVMSNTVRASTVGRFFGTWCDTTNSKWGYAYAAAGANLFVRTYTFNADGTLTSDFAEVDIAGQLPSGHNTGLAYPSLYFSGTTNDWVTVGATPAGGSNYVDVLRCSTTCGTATNWSTLKSIGYSVTNNNFVGVITPLSTTAKYSLVVGQQQAGSNLVKLMTTTDTGSTWSTYQNTTTAWNFQNCSVTSIADTTSVLCANGSSNPVYFNFGLSPSSAPTETVLDTGGVDANGNGISTDGSSKLVVTYCSGTSVYTQQSINSGSTFSTKITQVSSETSVTNCGSSYSITSSAIQTVWGAGSASPYNVRFAQIALDFTTFQLTLNLYARDGTTTIQSLSPRCRIESNNASVTFITAVSSACIARLRNAVPYRIAIVLSSNNSAFIDSSNTTSCCFARWNASGLSSDTAETVRTSIETNVVLRMEKGSRLQLVVPDWYQIYFPHNSSKLNYTATSGSITFPLFPTTGNRTNSLLKVSKFGASITTKPNILNATGISINATANSQAMEIITRDFVETSAFYKNSGLILTMGGATCASWQFTAPNGTVLTITTATYETTNGTHTLGAITCGTQDVKNNATTWNPSTNSATFSYKLNIFKLSVVKVYSIDRAYILPLFRFGFTNANGTASNLTSTLYASFEIFGTSITPTRAKSDARSGNVMLNQTAISSISGDISISLRVDKARQTLRAYFNDGVSRTTCTFVFVAFNTTSITVGCGTQIYIENGTSTLTSLTDLGTDVKGNATTWNVGSTDPSVFSFKEKVDKVTFTGYAQNGNAAFTFTSFQLTAPNSTLINLGSGNSKQVYLQVGTITPDAIRIGSDDVLANRTAISFGGTANTVYSFKVLIALNTLRFYMDGGNSALTFTSVTFKAPNGTISASLGTSSSLSIYMQNGTWTPDAFRIWGNNVKSNSTTFSPSGSSAQTFSFKLSIYTITLTVNDNGGSALASVVPKLKMGNQSGLLTLPTTSASGVSTFYVQNETRTNSRLEVLDNTVTTYNATRDWTATASITATANRFTNFASQTGKNFVVSANYTLSAQAFANNAYNWTLTAPAGLNVGTVSWQLFSFSSSPSTLFFNNTQKNSPIDWTYTSSRVNLTSPTSRGLNGKWQVRFASTAPAPASNPPGPGVGIFIPAPAPQAPTPVTNVTTTPTVGPPLPLPELDLSAQILIFGSIGIIVAVIFVGSRVPKQPTRTYFGIVKNPTRRFNGSIKNPTRRKRG